MSTGRSRVLGAVLALLAIPVALAIVGAVSFRVRNAENRTLMVDGRTRDYVLYVPTSIDRSRPAPLVISLHGAGLWGAAQRETSGWDRIAEREGVIVAYPSAAPGSGPRIWHVDNDPGLPHDVRFLAALIDTVEREYNVDARRIYANGLSNGGGMSFVLSCTLSDRIAAVGTVAAARTLPFTWCRDRRPVPVIDFHGTADPVIPYVGGASWISPRRFPRVASWAASWARRNGCGAVPVESVVAADVTRREYTHCARDASVVSYVVQGGGHTWPGGKPLPEPWVGRTATSIDATKLMWEFFSAHPLAGLRSGARREADR